MLRFAKKAFRAALRRHGHDLVHTSRNQICGWSLSDDLPLVVANRPPIIFDVGANVGQSIDSFRASFPGSTIYAFEPTTACISVLRSRFGNVDDVKVYPHALSDTEGEPPFYEFDGSPLNSALEPDVNSNNPFAHEPCRATTVRARTLDAVHRELGRPHIGLLKIDTQGTGLRVLHGATSAIEDRLIDAILIEITFAPLYKGQDEASEILSFLGHAGFRLVDLYGKNREAGVIAWCDGLFQRVS